MTRHQLLTASSLVTILLMSLHITDDIIRGISPARADNLGAVVIFAVWLTATLLLRERRVGPVLLLLGGVFAAAMPVLHMRGASYGTIAKSDGGFFFVWTLIMVGTTGILSVILSVVTLWPTRRRS